MSNFSFAFSAVLPVFLMIVLGYILRRCGYFSETYIKMTNNLCFNIAIPALVFYNIYKSNTTIGANAGLLLFGATAICAIALVSMLIVPKMIPELDRRSVLIQNMFRSNFVLFGIPMAANMYGENGVGPASILLAVSAILFNVLGTAVMAFYQAQGKSANKRGVHILPLLKSILQNHIIIGATIALVLLSTHVVLPNFLDKGVSDLAKIATPLGLMALGANFDFSKVKADIKYLVIGTSGKLVIAPAVVLALAALAGFKGPQLAALLGMVASPGSITSYVVAANMDADGELAGELVIFGTAFSALTMFLFILFFKTLGLL